MKHVLIIGAGGIGGYFAAVLHARGADVTILARGANAQAIREAGLRIENGPDEVHVMPRVIERLDPGESFDLVLVATKTPDTSAALAPAAKRLASTGAVVALQNGLGRGAAMSAVVGREVGLDGVVYLEARLVAPGTVRYFSGARRVEIGDPNRPVEERAQPVAEFLTNHGFQAAASSDPLTAAWRKLVLVATANALTATTRKPFGEIISGATGRSVASAMLSEAVTVARKDGAKLAPGHAEEALTFLTELGPSLRSSMLHDVERGRPTEVDFLNGEVVRRGREHSTPTPLHELAWLVLGDPH